MNLPDLNDVRMFAAAAQAGTQTAAAKELGVPPSTVGRALSRLEKRLGVLLVRRSPRGLVLTDSGKSYLAACRQALRTLEDGSDWLESQRAEPSGRLKVACPVTMARDLLAPLMKDFLGRYPELRVEIEPYAAHWDQEPQEDVDVFFKLRAPKDSPRRIRPYPSTARGLFASPGYIHAAGSPATPDDLAAHHSIGAGIWKLTRGKKAVTLNPAFRIVASDPAVLLTLALDGLGVTILPLWVPQPLTLCALFFGPSRLTPKVQALLDFLAEYVGTVRDPRLQQRWSKQYFINPSAHASGK